VLFRSISLTDIPRVIDAVITQHDRREANSLESVLAADREARAAAAVVIDRFAGTSVETTAA